MNWKEIEKFVESKHISKSKHDDFDLFIYNYTANTQYDWLWNDATMSCRGLIVDSENNIVALPFKKFFSLKQLQQLDLKIPNETFEVYEKMDGSLGILYKTDDGYKIATRGSFKSDQAIEATKILNEKYQNESFNDDYTYLFEIIYPENRIVVNYGDKRDLILLAVIDKKTGKDVSLDDISCGFEKVKKYPCDDFDKIMKLHSGENSEGFVVKFESGFRLKLKFEEYERIHKIVTNFSEKRIFEHIVEGVDIEEMIKDIPDEFYNQIKDFQTKVLNSFNDVENDCKNILMEIEDKYSPKTKKEWAMEILKFKKLSPILFNMVNGKDYRLSIFNFIKD
jgi:RNA ligase